MKNNNDHRAFKSVQLVQYQTSTRCSRCSGSRYLSQYSHVEKGICFKCRGVGVVKFVGKN